MTGEFENDGNRVVAVKGTAEDELVEERPTPETGHRPESGVAGRSGVVGSLNGGAEVGRTYSASPCRELHPIGAHWTTQSQR